MAKPIGVQLTGSGVAVEPTLTPSTYAFGRVEVGTAASQTAKFTLTAGSSEAAVTVTPFTNPDYRLSSGCPARISARSQCTLDVTFAPSRSGLRTETLSVSVGGARLSATVSGTAFITEPNISPPSFDFGTADVGSQTPPTKPFTVNAGSMPLTIAARLAATKDFRLSTTCGRLAAHASCTITVTFAPTAGGVRTTVLTAAPSLTAKISGTGHIVAPSVSPAAADFGKVYVGARSAYKTFIVSSGSFPLAVGTPATTDPRTFPLTSECGTTLARFSSCRIDVLFAPATVGDAKATLTIGAQGTAANAALTGTALARPIWTVAPTALTVTVYEPARSGSAAVTVTTSRASPVDLVVADAKIGGSDWFAISSNGCTTVRPGTRCAITITFTPRGPYVDRTGQPTAAGRATLTLASSDGQQRQVPLTAAFVPQIG
jgi:hypothetical protein